jgi:hypothetical protein
LGTGECKVPGGVSEARWDVYESVKERERAGKR